MNRYASTSRYSFESGETLNKRSLETKKRKRFDRSDVGRMYIYCNKGKREQHREQILRRAFRLLDVDDLILRIDATGISSIENDNFKTRVFTPHRAWMTSKESSVYRQQCVPVMAS
jgi:hypothetical protein